MVVNPPGWINRTLTEEEKTTMMKEGRCFRCGNKGHMSKACPTRPSPPSSSNTPKNKPQHARTTKVEEVDEEDDEELETKLGVNQVINSIHAMTEEEHEVLWFSLRTVPRFPYVYPYDVYLLRSRSASFSGM